MNAETPRGGCSAFGRYRGVVGRVGAPTLHVQREALLLGPSSHTPRVPHVAVILARAET